MLDQHEFYVIVPPGLEELAADELRRKQVLFVAPDAQPLNEVPEVELGSHGGFLVRSSLIFGLQMNYHLRIASRVLLRIGDFQVSGFPQLEAHLRKLFPRVQKFSTGPFLAQVSCSESQLNNEKRVTQTLSKVFKLEDDEILQKLYFRIHHNRGELSLDTSGEHLHMRGWRKKHAGAPLRETLAAALVNLMTQDISAFETQQLEVVDPFAGTGTLLREFAERLFPIKRPIAFQSWTGIPKILKSEAFLENYRLTAKAQTQQLIACDQSEEALLFAKENLLPLRGFSAAEVEFAQMNSSLPMSSEQKKLFRKPEAMRRWGIMNPPYGLRLELQFDLNEALNQITQNWELERFAIILPSSLEKSLNVKNYRRARWLKTTHGGLPVTLAVWDHLSLRP